ncbi:hypothetical protein GQ44DRAFT_770861 [Phaeosphaeriaceae sp. PMI808]|nr:hypothetical protein GQ44DRAFT_770861 [Phaeosphaeriaceae sp. PMI808]
MAELRIPSLESLPEELLQLIVAYLPISTLKKAALVCTTLNRHATDILWNHVCLVDQWKVYPDGPTNLPLAAGRGLKRSDEHDDTPIIQKLFLLASNPMLASKVHILTHRCHLPLPNIFHELPRMHFHTENLSQDARLYVLLGLAIRNMVNVHTLRIIYGHMRLTTALVVGFMNHNRPRRVPLRKLWLENCFLSPKIMPFLSPGNANGLESLRIRRLDAAAFFWPQKRDLAHLEFRPSRGGTYFLMHDGQRLRSLLEAERMDHAKTFDDVLWDENPGIEDFANAQQLIQVEERIPDASVSPMQWILEFSASTLTSLNLDWILWRRKEIDLHDQSSTTLKTLATLRFPHLTAFQLRNAVLQQTMLPADIFLFEDTFLEFMEYHHKLQCLAWPLDRFYSHAKPSIQVQNRSRKLTAHLGNMLTDLRVDALYIGYGEPITDASQTTEEMYECVRRRRFIAEFASHMRRIERIKLEGGLPRDEKREILRALHWCPLKKVVMIGVSYPVGNTWGHHGQALKALDQGAGWDDMESLEDEDSQGILEAYKRGFHVANDFQFEPDYGWPPQAPLLQTIALHHASTIEELKICGYNGCPILSYQTRITGSLLSGLRQFDNLKNLVMSFWLLTWYESSYRDTEIIKYWLESRSPSSTALAIVTPPRTPSQELPVDPGHFPTFHTPLINAPQFNRWAVALKTSFSPSALAYRVARDIGPYLSPVAKNRPGGVCLRASFCLGDRDERRPASDVFDLDVRIGTDNQVLEFTGPREEGERGRWWNKVESRRWF